LICDESLRKQLLHRRMTPPNPVATDLIQRHFACPKCRAEIRVEAHRYTCVRCGSQDEIRDGIFLAKPLSNGHYFDDMHRLMQRGNQSAEIWTLCYAQQSRIAAGLIRPGDVVLDIGCGPAIHFERPQDCVLIGVDPSFDSLRANQALDVGVFCGAEAMPLRDRSVDRIFFFYSIHHMVGQTVEENTANLAAALRECGRVVREGGTVVIFDMSPWWPAWQAQKLAWNRARKTLADKLDMFFWRDSALRRLAATVFSAKSFEERRFSVSPFLAFPPVFSLPNLKVPRLLYPFDIKMYQWSF
jgi:ubiquinone/menaquinone biosynthesis C-methylase UbiE